MKRILFAAAFALFAFTGVAHAQFAEVSGTPRTTLGTKIYGTWFVENGIIGTGIQLFEKQDNGQWLGVGGCANYDYDPVGSIAAAGTALNDIKQNILPAFNVCAKKYFDSFNFLIPATTAVGQLNNALRASCGFTNANVLACQ